MPEENNSPQAEKTKRFALRTFRADTAEFIKDKKFSLLDLASMKEHAKEGQSFVPAADNSFSKIKIVAIFIVCLIALAGGVYLYFYFSRNSDSKITDGLVSPPPAILVNQEEKILEISNLKDFKEKVFQALNASYGPGDLVYLPPKKRGEANYLDAQQFFGLIQPSAPAELTNFLEKNFFLGVINLQKKYPVLIFEAKENKYENVFSGMLAWERSMARDLSFFWGKESTAALPPEFKDTLIKSGVARIAETENGTLLYLMLNRKFVIITTGKDALEEIINRFVLYKFSGIIRPWL